MRRWIKRICSAPSASGLLKFAGIVLALVLLWFLLHSADWRRVGEQIRAANWTVLFFAWMFVGGCSWSLRAFRWRLLLTAETDLAFWPVFWANSAGNLGNNVLPARAGEFIRAAMVGARSGLTQRFILATAACERVLDLLVFVSLAEVVVWYAPGMPALIVRAIHIAFLFAVVGTISLVLAARSGKLVHWLIASGLRRPSMAGRIHTYLEPVLDGLRTIHSRTTVVGFVILSVFIWILDVLGAKLVAYAMGFSLSFPLAFVLTAGLVFINLIPATPGQLGVYQWVVIQVLAISRIEYNQALAYGVVLQACGYATLALLGVPGLLLYRRSRPKGTEVTMRVVGEIENPQWVEHPQ